MVATTPVVAAGGCYRNVSDVTTRNFLLSALVKPDGSAYSIVNGDFLLLMVFYAGASTTNSVSGLTGLTKLGDNQGSSTTATLYFKQNCVNADATATIAIATSAANKVCAIAMVLKNVPTVGPWNHGYSTNTQVSVANGASPTVVPSDVGGIRLELMSWSGNNAPTDVPHPDGSGTLTELRTENTGTLPTHTGSMSNSGTGGTAAGNIGYNPAALATTTLVGGTNWTPFLQSPNGNKNGWTIVIAPTVVSSINRPVSVISSTGYTNVGGTVDIPASLADELDTSYAETSDDPVSLTLEVKFPVLAIQNRVGLRSRLQAAQTGAVTYVISIYCGATLICTKTTIVAVGDGVVPDELLSNAAQAATITDWADLRARYVLTKV